MEQSSLHQKPYSERDWVNMEEKGFLPPASDGIPLPSFSEVHYDFSGPSKAECFQSSLTEKGYKAVAMWGH